MSRTQWTDEMIAIANGMKRAGIKTDLIAQRLGVTSKSVTNMCSKKRAKRRLDGHGGARKPTLSRIVHSNFEFGTIEDLK